MTIALGVLGTGSIFKPDTIVLAADTMGSNGDEWSTPGLHKIFVNQEERIYIAAADNIDRASELCAMIFKRISALARREHGPILDVLIRTVWDYHRQRSIYEVLPKYLLTPRDWRRKNLDPTLRQTVATEVMSYNIGCQLVIGTFADSGQALLYRVDGDGLKQGWNWDSTVEFVAPCNIPGFTGVGSGARNALFWLAYRNHQMGYAVRRAAYHAYEAKRMAESSPFVNRNLHFLIANREHCTLLTNQKPSDGDWSLDELESDLRKYGPQDTSELRSGV